MCTSYLTSTCNSVNHSQTATMVCITKKISLAYFCYSCRQATVYAAGILYSFLLMMLSVYVTTQRMIILQQATDYYSFNICCIESLQCISCVIKFNSKRKLSNYIYRTTPLFLSTHQKISTKMTSEYLVSALLVHDLLEHCIASCLALLYIKITSYYYSG